MVMEMLFNNKIQLIFFELNLNFFKIKYIVVYIIEGNLCIIFQFFYLKKLSIRYNLIYLKFCVMFK
jgi:hypothetical protein